MVIPVLANLLQHVGPEIEVFLSGPEAPQTLAMRLPFSWKALYFSGVACALATATYSFRCPKILLPGADLAAFRNEGKGAMVLAMSFFRLTKSIKSSKERIRVLNEYITLFYPEANQQLVTLDEGWEKKFTNWAIKSEMCAGRLGDAFNIVQTAEDQEKPITRLVCFSFYVVALLFLLGISVQNFIVVCRFL